MKSKKKLRKIAFITFPLAFIAFVLWADSDSVQLSNGANLAVSLDDPGEWIVLHDATDTDVDVSGTASIGAGEPDATFVYVIDTSGSTGIGGGTGCAPILDCEKDFFITLNDAISSDGSTDEVGIVSYGNNATTHLGGSLVMPTNPAVPGTIGSLSDNGGTNCGAALQAAVNLIGTSSNGFNTIVFASDGLCNTGPNVLSIGVPPGVVVHSVAIGAGSSCSSGGSTGTLNQIAQNGGSCFPVPDPGLLPAIIQNLIGSTLQSLEIEVEEEGAQFIGNDDIDPDLPKDAQAIVSYSTTVPEREPDDHLICVTANGTDVLGDSASVEACETAHLLQLQASPSAAVNDLNESDEHTVEAVIAGGTGPDRDVEFSVGGHNAATASPSFAAIVASTNVAEEFTYSVPQVCESLGTDTITVSTVIAGVEDSIELAKEWVDGTPPDVSCDPTVNPNGRNEPKAPGKGQNEDGFYQLNSTDPTLNCAVSLVVEDGSGYVFPGPFSPGDAVKYTQDDTTPQEQKKMGSASGQAGAVRWHLIGHGDLTVTATDTSGNSSSAVCLVPQPPK